MSRRQVHLWVWWLLPFLVARALMPVGFMAQAHDGKLQIVMCSAGVSLPGAQSAGDANAHGGKSFDAKHGDVSCPFAQAAAAPLLDVSGSQQIAFIPTAVSLPPAESPYYAAGPPRFIATRGPPVIA